jgi:hypothetical protein
MDRGYTGGCIGKKSNLPTPRGKKSSYINNFMGCRDSIFSLHLPTPLLFSFGVIPSVMWGYAFRKGCREIFRVPTPRHL